MRQLEAGERQHQIITTKLGAVDQPGALPDNQWHQQQQQQVQVQQVQQVQQVDSGEWKRQATSKVASMNNSGKLFLAAIVHYEQMLELNSPERNSPETLPQVSRKQQQQQQQVTLATRSKRLSLRKLGRLFSMNNKDHDDNELRNTKGRQDDAIMMDCLTSGKLMQTTATLSSSNSSSAPDTPTSSSTTTTKSSSDCATATARQVIEFKFDLIVEADGNDDDHDDHDKVAPPEGLSECSAAHARVLRPIKQRKLLDSVNELVESFVLDSTDVCLVSSGQASERQPLKSAAYVLQLAELTLTYAFQLLEATKRLDSSSIELEARLFEQQPLDSSSSSVSNSVAELSWIEATELLSPPTIECHSISEARQLLRHLNDRLATTGSSSKTGSNNLLMIGMKLKQTISGATFANRMFLIDLVEPARCQLAPLLESIFSGRALGHLKRQKVRLRALEIQLDLMRARRAESRESSASASSASSSSPEHNEKHETHGVKDEELAEFKLKHNQIASLTRLLQIEWLIYKQLSAALLKSLLIVHCRRLSTRTGSGRQDTTGSGRQDARKRQQQLMDYNLKLLEFARSLQRAAASRVRRRKRHLTRSHKRLYNNSDTNLSTINLSTEDLRDCVRRPRTRGHDDLLVIASSSATSYKQAKTSFELERARHQRFNYHNRRHNNNCHQHYYQQGNYHNRKYRRHAPRHQDLDFMSLGGGGGGGECLYLPTGSCATTSSRRRSDLSSSMSTSSGSQRGHGAQLRNASRPLASDTEDSLASATLNSCSSYSNRQSYSNRTVGYHNDVSTAAAAAAAAVVVAPTQNRTNVEMYENNSDICSVVAEPPRQLKLEQFLNQLSSAISAPPPPPVAPPGGSDRDYKTMSPPPHLGGSASNKSNHQDDDDDDDEDEEDCKSHSSILEHLSSLTLESSRSFARKLRHESISGGANESISSRVEIINYETPAPNGHLQQLLKSTFQLRNSSNSSSSSGSSPSVGEATPKPEVRQLMVASHGACE